MFRSHIIVALRSISRQKAYSFINIAGLATGMACFLLIFTFVISHLSFDRFHANADRIYRVAERMSRPDGFCRQRVTTGTPLAPAMLAEMPAVEKAVRFVMAGAILHSEDKIFRESGMCYVDSDLFDVFSFNLLRGNPANALREPNTAVVTAEVARKYFGDADPVGKTLTLENETQLTVTGILENITDVSHIKFDIAASIETLLQRSSGFEGHWDEAVWTYILLRKSHDPSEVEAGFPSLVRKYREDSQTAEINYWLQPLTSIHLHSDYGGEMGPPMSLQNLYIFLAIGLFILLIACINYINLSTACYADRAREVGVRKVLGAAQSNLMRQFLVESLLFSVIASCLAIVMAEVLLPVFNSVAGSQLNLGYLSNPMIVTCLIFATLIVAVISGGFPAFYLSAIKPVDSVRPSGGGGLKRSILRRSLVVFQFAISIILVVSTLTIFGQMSYLTSKELGFDEDQLVVLPVLRGSAGDKYDTLKREFLTDPRILAMTISSDIPGWDDCRGLSYAAEGSDEPVNLPTLFVDRDYVRTLGLIITEGRDFSDDDASGVNGFIINEMAAERFGWDLPIGKRIEAFAGDYLLRDNRVIGVVKDYHFRLLRTRLQPLVLVVDPDRCDFPIVRIDKHDMQGAIASMRDKWNRLIPGRPFEFNFVDQYIASQYRKEQQFGSLLGYACLLSLGIACLGLLGLASFTSQQRTKEIGIRKVLGASTIKIVRLLTREYVILIAVSNVIAWPIAYYLMKSWVENFPYRNDIGFSTLILSGALALAVALITVSFQAIKAALANPVESLRHE
ncbi:MAG: ABC transporter permease [Candidatus Zixiibacteriota bacterium]